VLKQSTTETINVWGSLFSFTTTVLLSIVLFILTGIKGEVKDIKEDTCKRFEKVDLQFSNHLEHHRQFEVTLAEKLTSLDATVRRWR
jgi:hypothetical protein